MEKLSKEDILKKIGEAIASSDNEEIRNLFEVYGVEDSDVKDLLWQIITTYEAESLEIPGIVKGGSERDYDEYYGYFNYLPTNQLIGFEGWYASHVGTGWEDDTLQEFDWYTTKTLGRKR